MYGAWFKGAVRIFTDSNGILGKERFKKEHANVLNRIVSSGIAGRLEEERVN